jgi:hypothetical protein
MPTESEIAWAAGLFEGEGCFSVSDRKGPDGRSRPQPVMTVTMADLDVLERFQAIVGAGSTIALKQDRRFPTHKPLWKWQLQRRSEIARVGERLRPWLSERRCSRLDEILRTRQENESIACTYCGTMFVPWRARKSANAFCSKICKARHHFGVSNPRYGNPPVREVG